MISISSVACGEGGGGASIGGSAQLLDPEFEAGMIDLETAWADAARMSDQAALDSLLADEFTIAGTEPEARLVPKRLYVQDAAMIQAGSSAFERPVVRRYDDVVIIDGALTGGPATLAVTDVWVRRSGRWRAVARHLSTYRFDSNTSDSTAPDSAGT